MKKTTLIIMFIALFTKTLGLVRDMILSNYYGAGKFSDAYLISITLPGIIFAFIGVGIATNFIPMYTQITKNEGGKSADRFMNFLINFLMILCTIICLGTFMFTEEIVKVLASGFEGETLRIAVKFTRITIFSIYFTGLIFVFKAYLEIKNSFIIAAIIGIPLNIIIIFSIIISAKTNILILPLGTVIAGIIQVALIIPFIYKKGYRHSVALIGKNKHLKNMIFLSIPVIIGASVNEINLIVDRTLASTIEVGGISAITYANRINMVIQGVIITSIATVIYPKISKMASVNNIDGLKSVISKSLVMMSILVLPASLFTFFFSKELVTLLFGRGEFNLSAIMMTSSALFFYSFGVFAVGIREIISRAFFALQDTKTPMVNAVIALIINIILNIIDKS